ncbi:MAG: hypothetical protein WDN67_04825 [Candidatus Moraniibacteriota bacterium]
MELIREERLHQKLSLKEVATRAGLSHKIIMRVEAPTTTDQRLARRRFFCSILAVEVGCERNKSIDAEIVETNSRIIQIFQQAPRASRTSSLAHISSRLRW